MRIYIEIERDRETALIEIGRGMWSEDIINCFHVRVQKIADRLRGEAM